MGSALAKSLSKQSLILFDRDYEHTSALAKTLGATAAKEMAQATQGVDMVLIAVKPYHLHEVAKQLEPLLNPKIVLLLSVLAGVRLSDLKAVFPKQKIISLMPNIAVEYGKGSSASSNPPI